DAHGVTWANYYQNVPQGMSFRPFLGAAKDPHFLPLWRFMLQAAGSSALPPLPQVVFVDPNFGPTALFPPPTAPPPPTDIHLAPAHTATGGPRFRLAPRQRPPKRPTRAGLDHPVQVRGAGGVLRPRGAARGAAGRGADAGRRRPRAVRRPVEPAGEPSARRRS